MTDSIKILISRGPGLLFGHPKHDMLWFQTAYDPVHADTLRNTSVIAVCPRNGEIIGADHEQDVELASWFDKWVTANWRQYLCASTHAITVNIDAPQQSEDKP